MNIDTGSSDDEKGCGRAVENNKSNLGTDDDECGGRCAHKGCFLLESLPRDLLTQSILGRYLDGTSLSNFWCATMSKREIIVRRNSPRGKSRTSLSSQSLSMVEEIHQIIQRRRALLTEEWISENSTNNEYYYLRRKVFQAFEEAIASQPTATTPIEDSLQPSNFNGSNKNTTDQEALDETKIKKDQLFDFGRFLVLSRGIFGSLSAIDYCERVPHNLIWCGILRINDRQRGMMIQTDDLEPIKVALVVHPRRWSMKEIRLWRNATTWSSSSGPTRSNVSFTAERRLPTVKADVIPHNFLPVGPNRGRLVGLTESDRSSLREIAGGLNRSDLVGRFSCMIASIAIRDEDNTAVGPAAARISDNVTNRNHGGQFTVKLMGFDQAQRKLNTVFRRGYEPGGIPLSEEKNGMVLHGPVVGEDHDRNSLLCCWNHEFLWEDPRPFRMETSYAMRDTMKEYDRLTQ